MDGEELQELDIGRLRIWACGRIRNGLAVINHIGRWQGSGSHKSTNSAIFCWMQNPLEALASRGQIFHLRHLFFTKREP